MDLVNLKPDSFLSIGMAAMIWGKLYLIPKFSLLHYPYGSIHQPSSQPRAMPIPSITQAFVKVQSRSAAFPHEKLSGTGSWPLLKCCHSCWDKCVFKNSPFGRSLGDNVQHSWPGRFFFISHSTLRNSLWHLWRIRRMRLSLVEQICSQFVMYFMMASLGGDAFNGVSCIVSSLDADFSIFCFTGNK